MGNVYRMDIRYPASRGGYGKKFRILLTEDMNPGTRIMAEIYQEAKPSRQNLRDILSSHGLEAYGDLKIMSDGVLRTMARKAS